MGLRCTAPPLCRIASPPAVDLAVAEYRHAATATWQEVLSRWPPYSGSGDPGRAAEGCAEVALMASTVQLPFKERPEAVHTATRRVEHKTKAGVRLGGAVLRLIVGGRRRAAGSVEFAIFL